MTDFETWLHDNCNRVYRYWVYKRMFTPLEVEAKYMDQTCYEGEHCCFGMIYEAIELPDGDVLLGFIDPAEDNDSIVDGYVVYHKLSEIHLEFCPHDMEDEDA